MPADPSTSDGESGPGEPDAAAWPDEPDAAPWPGEPDAAVWLDVLAAADLGPATVHRVVFDDGDDVVLWRGANGAVHACDSRCPHAMAHFAVFGAVDGDELVCTAHQWRFDGDGNGSVAAATGDRTERNRLALHPCRERAGRIEIVRRR